MFRQLLVRLFGPSDRDQSQRSSVSAEDVGQQSPSQTAQALGSGDLITGLTFFATHQVRTPLRILLRNGEQHNDMQTPPPDIAEERWQGIWTLRTRTWRDLGLNLDEFQPDTVASDAGQVKSEEYLPFLIAVRSIVERHQPIEVRREQLREELRRACWSDFCRALGGEESVMDRLFTPFIATLVGLPTEARSAMRAKGLHTPAAISNTPDAELLLIDGIGPARLQQIRAACNAAEDKTVAFLDRVIR